MPSLAKKLYDEGLEDGLQAAKAMLFDLIEIKFGAPDPALTDRIKQITDLDTLQRLSHAIKTAKSPQDLLKEF